MEKYAYIKNFERMGLGTFVHFGLYSIVGKGEWYLSLNRYANKERYEKLPSVLKVKKGWAKEIVRTAKALGAKYITFTARHHDGFSLFDTQGLSDYDSVHSACGRDLAAEFVEECRKGGIVPFFYHTLLDWHHPDYRNDFPKYIDYLDKSIEILCRNYGKIGGFWFDGMWDKKDVDWQEDRIYGTIRKYQPEALIINNTGLSAMGKTGHKEIDSVTFERGKPSYVDRSEKPIAGEMCQILNDHWGYAANDCNYKSIKSLIEDLVDCRKYNCNFLLNVGLTANGGVKKMDAAMLAEIGKWVKANKNFIYNAHSADVTAENADILTDGEYYYAVVRNSFVGGDENVTKSGESCIVKVNADICKATWLDNGKRIRLKKNSFAAEPFEYGRSLAVRVARFQLKNQ